VIHFTRARIGSGGTAQIGSPRPFIGGSYMGDTEVVSSAESCLRPLKDESLQTEQPGCKGGVFL